MQSLSVLVCEDEMIVAKEIMMSLRQAGYQVAGHASSGKEALEIAEKFKPDLALMDINLRGPIDGTKVASLLMEHFEIPSIFLTAYADKETIGEAKVSNPLGYLLKPLNSNELFSTIETSFHHYISEKEKIAKMDEGLQSLYDEPAVEQFAKMQKLATHHEKQSLLSNTIKGFICNIDKDLEIISNQLEILIESEELTPKLASNVRTAIIHQEYLRNFIDNLYLMSEDSEIEREVQSVDSTLLLAISNFIESETNQVSFIRSFYPEPLYASIHKDSLVKALHHIILNAYQANPESAVINVGTSLILVESPENYNPRATPGWYVQIRITDYGDRINQNDLEKATEPFFKKNKESCGWGIGLSIADNIITRHNGWLVFDNSREIGTTVSVFIPELNKS